MTNEQKPEAIRLAEWIEEDMTCNGDAEIAAELRRQHAEITELKQRLADSWRDLQALKADPAPCEWIEWKGGECPIADGVRYALRFKNGEETESRFGTNTWNWFWTDGIGGFDIVAYRVMA